MEALLAIETSCDETAVAVLSPEGILSEEVYSQSEHARFGGVVPELAARDHQRRLPSMVHSVLSKAGLNAKDLVEIAYTHGPGLAGCLLVGHHYALGLSLASDAPLRGIHHLEGHVMSVLIGTDYATWFDAYQALCPALVLVVSGGHTILLAVREGAYTYLGETADDAVGEVFDKIARLMGLPYPGGAKLSAHARQGRPVYPLPRPMIQTRDASMSFSGLKTAAAQLYHQLGLDGQPWGQAHCDFAASVESALVDTLMHKITQCADAHELHTVAVCGGVAANQLLRERILRWCAATGRQAWLPHPLYCGDNASMIGVAAWIRRATGMPVADAAIRLRARLLWEG